MLLIKSLLIDRITANVHRFHISSTVYNDWTWNVLQVPWCRNWEEVYIFHEEPKIILFWCSVVTVYDIMYLVRFYAE
jgi:hypothetical protein